MNAPLALCFALLNAAPPARAPVFNVHPLGVLGGDDDTNLSAYVVGTPERPEGVLVDAGSLTRGLAAWKLGGPEKGTATERVAALKQLFQSLSGVLITHSHLDHVSGLLLDSPVLMAAGRKAPLPLFALPQTLAALKAHAFESPLWIDLTRVPKDAPALSVAELPPGKTQPLGDFTVETVELTHAVPAAAFLLGRGQAYYLHLGDTGPTEAVWKRAQPLLAAGKLRAVAVEVSFASKNEALALSSGHLTPALLLKELIKLTGITVPRDASPRDVARALGAALGGCSIMAIHIKASAYDEVVADLGALKAAGLPLVIPEAGAGYLF